MFRTLNDYMCCEVGWVCCGYLRGTPSLALDLFQYKSSTYFLTVDNDRGVEP
jgi:hypothetical protein